MNKLIKFNDDARQSIKEGIDILANAVKTTLGPKGRTVIIEDYNGPRITKDGVSVAKSIELEDRFQNAGVQLVKQVAAKTCDDAGDGTTTATVLAQAIINQGLKNVVSGANPMDLKRGIDKAVDKVVEYIQSISENIGDDFSKIEQIATISANNDQEIGKLIADAMKKVSKDGVITIEEAKGRETTIGVVEGMQFDSGYLSPYFVTNTEKMECELLNTVVCVYNQKIDNIKDLLPLLEPIARENKSLLLITDDIDNESLNTLVMNRIRSQLKICVVRAPGFGDNRFEIMKDIATIVGGSVICPNKGISFDNNLGFAEKIIIRKDSTTIIGGNGDSDLIKERVLEIKNLISSCDSNIDKLKLRLAKLLGGVAVLYVGASSEIEVNEKKDRIEDALCATRAALEEGIVPGGGTTYIRALQSIYDLKGDNEDENYGINIIKNVLEAPLRQIAINSGQEPAIIISEVMEGNNDYGYNAKADEFTNLLRAGIIDPAKVTRTALENAASIAGLFLTTECVIVNND